MEIREGVQGMGQIGGNFASFEEKMANFRTYEGSYQG
jgi:hypothetical protein